MREFRGNGIDAAGFFLDTITTWTPSMTYRTYSGPRGSETIAPLEKDRLLYKEFDTLDAALAWARHVNDGGRVALLIEGDDGTHLGKREIAGALHHREAPRR
jgi:hypothetical protein